MAKMFDDIIKATFALTIVFAFVILVIYLALDLFSQILKVTI